MSSKLEGTSSVGKRENQNIQVYVRVRPLVGSVPSIIETPGTREVVVRERTVANITKTFTFDRVFDLNSSQQEVYRVVVAPLLKEVLLGYNCTVFAYGQTGTGKTYTMEGELQDKKGSSSSLAGPQPPLCESAHAGILPRALSQLFDEVRKMDCEFQVRASFLELYNEELCDLLATVDPNQSKKILRIYEDSARKGSVVIQGLEEVIVQNKQEVYDVLTRGSLMRKTAATKMNHSSSRSHTVFTITVHMKESSVDGEEMVKVGKLHLVDLAGSENIGKSGAVDKRAREAGSINQSLLTLGRVISALVERTPHVPYRESKLTRLLQDSLGGKTKTSIIATISPATAHIEETLSTLDYAHRAKNIMNKPEVNQRLTKREALNIYTEEIERLRKDLMAARDGAGFFIDLTNYNNLQNQITSMNLELIEKTNHIQSLKDSMEEKDKEINLEIMKRMELEEDITVKDTLLDNANANNLQLKARLASTLNRVDELQHLLKAHTETEKKLAGEADVLLQTTNDTVKTIESLHARLDRKKKVEETNLKHTDRFRKNLDKLLNDAEASLEKVKERNVLQTLDYFKLEDERKPLRKNLFDECHTVVSNTFNACMKNNIQFTDYIEKLEKGMSHAIADSNMNFMVAMDNSDKSASSMKDSLSDMVQAAKTQFGSMNAEINNLKTLIAKEFDQLEQDIKSTLSKDVAEFARLETVMTNLMSSFKTMAEHLDTNDRCFELRQQQYKGQYQQKITDMQRTLQELLTDTDEYVGGSAKSQKELVEKFSASREDCDTMLAEELKALQIAKTVPQETASNLNHYRERNVTSHQNHLTHLHEKVEERIQSTRQLEKKVSSVVTAHNEMLQERLTSVKAHNETINGTLKLFLNNTNPCQTSLHKTYEHSREAFHKMLSNVADTESVFVSELHKSVDNQLEQLSDGLDRTANEIRKINGFQNEFWDVNYLKDLPTGATPMKREYQYPTKLSATSPHERVLSRYRSVSKTIRDTLVEQDSVVSDFSSTEMCVLVGESDGKNTAEERDRQKRESEVFEREQEERRLQRLEWEEQERQRLLLHKKTQVKLKKGVPFNEVLQDLARVKSPQEKMEEKNMDALMEKEGEIDLKDKNVTKCEVPRESSLDPVQNRPFSDGVLFEVSEAKENAVPTSKAAGGPSKKRRNSGGNKKKARSK